MKFISVLKAIASGIIWGLGQVLNGQFFKALFFFIPFLAFVGLELGTSKYLVDTDPYDKIPGVSFGDLWVTNKFSARYADMVFRGEMDEYEDFTAYLVEIGGLENLDEQKLIEFVGQDLVKNNPAVYWNLATPNVKIPAEDFLNPENNIHIFRRQDLFKDANGLYYLERNRDAADGTSTKEYVEITVLSGVINENNILDNKDGLTDFKKNGEIYRLNGVYYVRVNDAGVTKHINILTGEVSVLAQVPTRVQVSGPLYVNNGVVYEYFEPNLVYLGARLQYKETPFTVALRASLRDDIYGAPGNRRDNEDFTKFMIRVYLAMNPEVKETFETQYDEFYYDQAGIFVRGYWSVITLGVAEKIDFNEYNNLRDALIGTSGSDYPLASFVSPAESVPIIGHISTMLMLQGLIAIIGSFFFFIFMFWSIKDAYQVAEAKRMRQEVLHEGKYFKSVYEDFFEYIILSPALLVLAFISIMPITFGFIMAFTSISGPTSMVATFDWVGLQNFTALFDFSSGFGASFGQAFWRVLGWTFIWAILSTFTVFFGGFIQALILNSEKVVFRKLWRTILILPWAIPALLSQMVFSVMFNDNGFINAFLRDIGVYDVLTRIGMLGREGQFLTGLDRLLFLGEDNIRWFSNPFNPTFVRLALVIVNIWLGFPYFMALMTGIMTAIDKTLYEAADIDGATGMQKITQITMPLVLYSTAPILIMTFSGNFNNFGVIYFITGGGPNAGNYNRGFAGDTDILISWMYKLTVDESIYNMASVFSVLIFLFVGSITAWNLSRTKAFQED